MSESFEHFRIEGILTYNLKKMNKQKPVYQSERQGTDQNRIQRCTQCKKFIQMKTLQDIEIYAQRSEGNTH